jgi:hypothetical protein
MTSGSGKRGPKLDRRCAFELFAALVLVMEKDYLTLKRASTSHPSGEWNDDDFDVLADGIVGRIMRVAASPVDAPWLWMLAFGHHEDRTPTHGYGATREAAFAKTWRRE